MKLWHSRHCTIFVQDFYETCCRSKAGKTCQIDSGLCVAGASQHASFLCIERVDVARSSKIMGAPLRIGKCADSGSAVVATDTCGAAFQKVNCYGERRAQHGGVIFNLMGQA